MSMFGQQGGAGGGFHRNTSCQICGSADPQTCFCKSNPSSGVWGGSGGDTWTTTGMGAFGQQQLIRQQQLPETVHIIVDSHIYEVNCDGTPIDHIVQAIKSYMG